MAVEYPVGVVQDVEDVGDVFDRESGRPITLRRN